MARRDRQVLDLVTDTLVLGDADAAKLMKDGRDPLNAPATEIPAVLKDTRRPAFYRNKPGSDEQTGSAPQ